jgi:Na+/melibiose symporter-like transporter
MLSFSMILFLFEKHSIMQFRVLGSSCVLLGVITTIFYILNIRETQLSSEAEFKEKLYARQTNSTSDFSEVEMHARV